MSSKGNPPRRPHGAQDAPPHASSDTPPKTPPKTPPETPEDPPPGTTRAATPGARNDPRDPSGDPERERANGSAGGDPGSPAGGSRKTAPGRTLQSRHGPVETALRTCVAPGYSVEANPDAGATPEQASSICIRKNGIDSRTGDRHAEELVIEVASKGCAAVLDERARALAARGVRRVFAIPVRGDAAGTGIEASPLEEWIPARNVWQEYARDEPIVDPCLYEPLAARALLEAVEADHAVAQAVLGGRVDAIEEYGSERYQAGKDEGYRAGKSEGYRAGKSEGYRAGKSEGYRAGKNEGYRAGANDGVREAVLLLLRARGIDLDEVSYARIAACDDMETLQRWLTRAADVDEAAALFGDA